MTPPPGGPPDARGVLPPPPPPPPSSSESPPPSSPEGGARQIHSAGTMHASPTTATALAAEGPASGRSATASTNTAPPVSNGATPHHGEMGRRGGAATTQNA